MMQDEAVEAVVTALLDMVEHPEEPMKITWYAAPAARMADSSY